MLTGNEISETTPLKPQQSKFGEFLQSFSELRKSKKDLYYLFGVVLAKNLGLMVLNASITTYLSSIHNFSDVTIGYIIASFGTCVFIYSIILGSFIDTYGVRTLLITGNLFALTGFIIVILVKSPYIQVFFMLTFISGGNSIILPSVKLGIKHYANEKARSLGYSMLFVIIYSGVAISGIIVDVGLTTGGKNENTFKVLFMIGACLLFLSTSLSFFITPIKNNPDSSESWKITKEVIFTKSFLKFFVLVLLLVVAKSLYSQLNIILPLYMQREITEDAHFGYLLAVHKGIVILFLPILTSLVYYFNSYTLIVIGSGLSALSVVPLLFSASYSTVVIFIIILSVSESVYAPRIIDYTLSIAPEGKEGTYLAMGSAPLSLSVIIAGIMGGYLLDGFCPKEGERECWAMWGIIGMTSLSVPILLLLFRCVIEENNKSKY